MFRRAINFVLMVVALLAVLFALSMTTFAQCAMCKAALTNSSSSASLIKSINIGSLVLLAPPVTLFCVIFGIAYKRRSASVETRGREED